MKTSTPPKNRLQEYYRGTRQELSSAFEKSKSVNHNGERGAARESFVEHFLKKSFPQKFVVGTGEIIDPAGGVSPQSDVVVYDETLPILHYGNANQFLVEGVLAHLEIKSSISKSEVEDILGKSTGVKSLKYDVNPSMHYGRLRPNVSSFGITYECPTSKETLKRTVGRYYGSNTETDKLANGVFVLRDGFVKGDSGLDFFDAGDDILLIAFLRLYDAMWKNWSAPPSLGSYVGDLQIPRY